MLTLPIVNLESKETNGCVFASKDRKVAFSKGRYQLCEGHFWILTSCLWYRTIEYITLIMQRCPPRLADIKLKKKRRRRNSSNKKILRCLNKRHRVYFVWSKLLVFWQKWTLENHLVQQVVYIFYSNDDRFFNLKWL